MNILILALGGALGTVLRYFSVHFISKYYGVAFPLGTLAVNLSGSLFIGFLWGLFEIHFVSHHLRLFLIIGLLGGFTTFSSFSMENLNLLREGAIKLAVLNILVCNIGGILLAYLGFLFARAL